MQDRLRKAVGHEFDGIYAYTGLPGSEDWAKPNPDMILHAADVHWIDLEDSWMVGDQDRDIAMAKDAGVGRTIRIRGDREIEVEADYTVETLAEVASILAESMEAD